MAALPSAIIIGQSFFKLNQNESSPPIGGLFLL